MYIALYIYRSTGIYSVYIPVYSIYIYVYKKRERDIKREGGRERERERERDSYRETMRESDVYPTCLRLAFKLQE